MAQLTDYRQPDWGCRFARFHLLTNLQFKLRWDLCFCCSASFECKGLFQRHDRCCPFSDLAVDLLMRILPETPTMIAGIPTDHLPGFERSVNAAIRWASVGGSCPPANRPFYQCRFAGEQRRPKRQFLILRLFLEVLRHKQSAERFWHGRCCSNDSNNYCTAG